MHVYFVALLMHDDVTKIVLWLIITSHSLGVTNYLLVKAPTMISLVTSFKLTFSNNANF